MPSRSTAAPFFAACHASYGATAAWIAAQSAAESASRPVPSTGATASRASAATAPAQAGLTPPSSGSERPASTRASGKPSSSGTGSERSLLASDASSASLRFMSVPPRASSAATPHRVKKSETLARTVTTAAQAAAVPAPSARTPGASPSSHQAEKAASSFQKRSRLVRSTPGRPLRSCTGPTEAIASRITWRTSASSAAASAGTTPSPLKSVPSKTCTRSATSAGVSSVGVGLLRAGQYAPHGAEERPALLGGIVYRRQR